MKPSKYMREDNAYEKDIEKPISKLLLSTRTGVDEYAANGLDARGVGGGQLRCSDQRF